MLRPASRALAALAVVSVPFFGAPKESTPADHSIELAGVRAVLVEHGEGFEGLRPFHAQGTGITVALLVRAKRNDLVMVDRDASKVTAFVDDRRGSLVGDTFEDGLGAFPEVADDRAAALVEVHGSRVPEAGAKTARLTGSVALRTATRSEPIRAAAARLAKGQELVAGAWTFELGAVERSGDSVEFELETHDDPAAISELRFFGADDRELVAESAGSSSMRIGSSGTWTHRFRMTAPPDRIALEIQAWTDLKTVEAPFDVTFAIPR